MNRTEDQGFLFASGYRRGYEIGYRMGQQALANTIHDLLDALDRTDQATDDQDDPT